MGDQHGGGVFSIDEVKDYLREYYGEHKRLPSIQMMAKRFSVSSYKMIEIFRILVHEGFLRRNFSRYRMIERAPTAEEEPRSIMGTGWVLVVMRVIMAVIALVAVTLSIYYTTVWLEEFLPEILALLLSAVMITFSTMAFEIVIMLGRGGQRSLATVFVLLWVVVLFFSMVSTVAGQYNQRIKNEAVQMVQNTEMTYKRTVYESYQAEERNLQIQVQDKMSQRTTLQKLIAQFDTLEKQQEDVKTFNDLSWRITVLDGDTKKLNEQLAVVRGQSRAFLQEETKSGLTQETTVKIQSFYVWIGSLFKVQPMYVEFWLSIFPAVFIDVIAPLSLSFTLFANLSTRKRRKKGT